MASSASALFTRTLHFDETHQTFDYSGTRQRFRRDRSRRRRVPGAVTDDWSSHRELRNLYSWARTRRILTSAIGFGPDVPTGCAARESRRFGETGSFGFGKVAGCDYGDTNPDTGTDSDPHSDAYACAESDTNPEQSLYRADRRGELRRGDTPRHALGWRYLRVWDGYEPDFLVKTQQSNFAKNAAI
jgi:hypothetical protein